MTGCTDSRYEQFETSSETIDQWVQDVSHIISGYWNYGLSTLWHGPFQLSSSSDCCRSTAKRRGTVVVSISAWHFVGRGSNHGTEMFYFRCTSMGLKFSTLDSVYLMCISSNSVVGAPFRILGKFVHPTLTVGPILRMIHYTRLFPYS